MLKRELIINADGFGFTSGINKAIFEVAHEGSISSISVNTNFQAVGELQSFHRKFPSISVGVHLNPIAGRPVSDIARVGTLLRPDGMFWGSAFPERLGNRKIDLRELYFELLNQVEVVEKMGIPVSHLDSHQNSHLLPRFFPLFLKVAKAKRISRMRTHRHFICAECSNRKVAAASYYMTHPSTLARHAYTRCLMRIAQRQGMRMAQRLMCVGHATKFRKDSITVWKSILNNVPPGVSEIYCHPAYPDESLRMHARYVDEREGERKVLMSDDFRRHLHSSEIELIGFQNV